ncbi:MAG: hypothetical protein R3B54_00860 [Bdellovibrionota bacterium]
MRLLVGAFVFILLCGACADSGNTVGAGARPGWTQDKIKNLIACEPSESEDCKCVVGKVTAEYTPEQVEQKSPYVAKRMLEIEQECRGGGGVVSEKPIENPQSLLISMRDLGVVPDITLVTTCAAYVSPYKAVPTTITVLSTNAKTNSNQRAVRESSSNN